jgi:tetratricopeptide (TPR) repeat protein
MRKINAKLLLGLLLGTMFATGAVFGVHRFQYDRIADSLLWQARRAEEQGDVKRQARYLQRYLEFHPKDDEQKARLAQLWAGDAFADALKQRRRAVYLLDDVLAQGEDRPELRRLLVKLALEVGQLKMARNHLEKLLSREFLEAPPDLKAPSEQTLDPQRGESAGYAGQLLDSENQREKARRCYLLALHHAPQVESNYLLLAHLLRRQEQIESTQAREDRREADRIVDRLVANNPHSHAARLTRWNYRRIFGLIQVQEDKSSEYPSLTEAAKDVEEALRLAPDSLEALLAGADLERFRARVAVSSPEVTEVMEKNRQEHRDKALAILEQGLALHLKKERPAGIDVMGFRLLWHKANLLLDDREWLEDDNGDGDADKGERHDWTAKVTRTLEQIRATRGSRAAIDFLQARLLLLEHQWNEAVALLEQVRPVLTTQRDLVGQINRCLGKCYEKLDEAGPMFEAYQRLQDTDPYSAIPLIGMARAETMMGHLEKASALFRKLYARGQMPSKLYLEYARLEIQRQSQEQRPDWANVEKLMDATEKLNPKAVEVPLLRAQLYLARDGKSTAADSVLREAQREKDGNKHVELWIARIQLEMLDKDKNIEAARALLAKAKKQLGDRVVALRLVEARLLADEKAKAAEAPIERLADDIEQFSKEEDKAQLLSGLAEIQMGLGNLAAARRLYQCVVLLPSKKTDLSLHLLLFDLASRAEDEDGIRQALDAIRALEGEKGPYHRYGEALRLIAQARKQSDEDRAKTLEEASAHLERVRVLRPKWSALFVARAQIERMSGRDDGAIRNLRLAKENGETGSVLVRELVELLTKVGRYDEADAELRAVRGSLLVHSDLGRMAASLAALRKDTERAGKLFELNRSDDSGRSDYRQLLWDGRLLAETNRPKEAEVKLRAAQKAAPREVDPYVSLVQFLVRQKRDKEVDAILEQARKHLPAEEVDLTLANCYELMGQKQKAQKCYEAALQGQRQNASVVRRVAGFYWYSSQLAATEPLLREILDKRVHNASSDDMNWARWHLALVLANGTDYRRFREALSLVGLKLDDKGQLVRMASSKSVESSDMRRFQARVLASQPSHRQFRQYACELLEEMERNKALPSEDRFLLGMLYEAEHDWSKAKPILRELADQKEPAPRHLAYYVQMLLEHKELDAAAKQLERLETLEEQHGIEPNAFGAVDLRAQMLEEQQRGDKAIKLLENHIERKNANPDEVLLVLNALHRQKKFAQAFDRCVKAWKDGKCTPEMIGGASIAVLRDMQTNDPPTPEQVAILEGHLNEALKAHPKNVALMLHLAELYDQRGRWEEAEKMYRRILEPDNEPKNIVALNNLAWLLAQRSNDPRKHREALEYVEEAVNGIGRRADLMDTRGMVYMKLGQHTDALNDFRAAANDLPTAANLFHLARAHYKVSDKSNASKILKQAQEQGLQASVLHPSEQDDYQRLLMELNVR